MIKRYRILAGSVVAAALFVSAPRMDAAAAPMLPDLRQAPIGCPGGFGGDPLTCTDWDVCLVADPAAPSGRCVQPGDAHAARLRFTSSEDNIGDGPLLLYGHRDGTGTRTMTVRQAIQYGDNGAIPRDYAAAQRATAAYTYYEPASAHQHWHVMGFEHFELRTRRGDTVVADRKNGFCLGDRYAIADAQGRAHLPTAGPTADLSRFLQGNMCEHHGPTALNVTEGISVGSGDDYEYTVDFQWLDITHVPAGTYDLVNTVNGDHTLLEKDYGNNSAAVAVSIQWPGGAPTESGTITAAPVVKFVRSCPGKPTCA